MNGTIICAVGDADEADTVVRVATGLGERFGARVVLVGVAHAVSGRPAMSEGEIEDDAQGRVQHRLARITEEHGLEGRVEHRVEIGDPVEALVDVAGEEAAELIVVGARAGMLRRTLKTAFARDLASAAPCPVVVVPPDLGRRRIDRPRLAGATERR